MPSAADYADAKVAAAREDPLARLALMGSLYEAAPGRPELHLPYRRAAVAFMDWEVRRGLLRPTGKPKPGSPWWRAINERLLHDTAEARGHLLGFGGPVSRPSVAHSVEFARHPSVRAWYRAHNATIVQAYLDNRDLAEDESRVERFFINLVLIRVLYAHALVAAPRLAMGWLWPIAPLLGDPRLMITGIFMSLSRVLPDEYPLRGDLQRYVSDENRFGRLLDIGVITPRLDALYAWSAVELAIPEAKNLVRNSVPTYAWDSNDTEGWHQTPKAVARALRGLLPAQRFEP